MNDLSAVLDFPRARSVQTFNARHATPVARLIVEEVPIGFRYGGIAYAVMMATPEHVEDFALGFSLTERIITAPADITGIAVQAAEEGLSVDITLGADAMRRFLRGRRVRQVRGHTSCGLCGVEDLADVRHVAQRVRAGGAVSAGAVAHAVESLRAFQTLSRATHGAHAAAWVAPDGAIRTVREDVGRHNALDKLIGARLRHDDAAGDGFCLVTSRCSFEMVQKAVAAGYPALVAMSAPTALAVRTAEATGLALYASAARGPDRYTALRNCEVESCP
jgi:FdhD protein